MHDKKITKGYYWYIRTMFNFLYVAYMSLGLYLVLFLVFYSYIASNMYTTCIIILCWKLAAIANPSISSPALFYYFAEFDITMANGTTNRTTLNCNLSIILFFIRYSSSDSSNISYYSVYFTIFDSMLVSFNWRFRFNQKVHIRNNILDNIIIVLYNIKT